MIISKLRWYLYTAAQCERDMRRMTNGERGCANPAEHLRKGK